MLLSSVIWAVAKGKHLATFYNHAQNLLRREPNGNKQQLYASADGRGLSEVEGSPPYPWVG